MRVVSSTVACVVLLVAGGAGAQEVEPAGTSAPTPTPTPPTTPPASRDTFLLTATAKVGSTDEAERHGRTAGGIESALLLAHGPVQVGARTALDVNGEEGSAGLALTLGLSLPLRPALRLDVHGDVGFTHYSRDSGWFLVVAAEETTGSAATLGTAALRAGVTFGGASGRFVTLGAFARRVARQEVDYTVRSCVLLFCSEEPRSITYGGTTVGAFVTVGSTVWPR